MPELCRFYGVRIKLYNDDHNPPHFHADIGGDEALISVDTLEIIAGHLRRRAARTGVAGGRKAPLRVTDGLEAGEEF